MKTMTPHAEAAKAIRQELKKAFPAVKFTVRSRGYSMGNAVDVEYTDGPASKEVEAIVGKYQHGHFDGMTDCYEYSNSRKDIPQVKFVMVKRSISDTTRTQLAADIADRFGIDNPTDDREWFDKLGCWPDMAIYRQFRELSL